MTTTPTPTDKADDHGFELKSRRKWLWIAVGLVVAVVAVVAVRIVFFSDTKSANETAGATLVAATQEGYAGEKAVIEFVAREVAPRYGIKVAFRGLSDSNTINRAVSEGEVAATTYQHKLWLAQVLESNPDFRLTAAAPIFRWAFGVWSDKYRSPQEIPNGATISLLADPANESLGLWYLAQAGLITLRPDAGSTALTQRDIVANPRNLQFKLLDFGAQARALRDLDAAAGFNGDYLLAGIPKDKLIFAPKSPDDYASVLTVGSKWTDTENIKKLVAAFHDPAVQQFLATDPTNGELLPL
ncbi:MetQ/NlpA family ABC transporter substrate-binding protein [Mycolicibacterium tusciae]|jgi:ABC-type metal ion transport system substrate-binding protein|uniref:MetQ/NlpA family ABC transporter substrate-binding protein n=1 Tax=Mycolicibacterium tusciae TaxID=75922 RepID=UPI00024A473B|nr:MetQ/NlpA family ABC transporter substrate-binding protein [Mycolicibacterium tusciae]